MSRRPRPPTLDEVGRGLPRVEPVPGQLDLLEAVEAESEPSGNNPSGKAES